MKYFKILKGLSLVFIVISAIIFTGKNSAAQDYDGSWCKSTVVVNNNSGLWESCLVLKNYDGSQIGLYFRYKEGDSDNFVDMLEMVSPGVFQTKAAARGGVNFFKGIRVTFITSNKVIYEGYGNANGSLIEKIIYTK